MTAEAVNFQVEGPELVHFTNFFDVWEALEVVSNARRAEPAGGDQEKGQLKLARIEWRKQYGVSAILATSVSDRFSYLFEDIGPLCGIIVMLGFENNLGHDLASFLRFQSRLLEQEDSRAPQASLTPFHDSPLTLMVIVDTWQRRRRAEFIMLRCNPSHDDCPVSFGPMGERAASCILIVSCCWSRRAD